MNFNLISMQVKPYAVPIDDFLPSLTPKSYMVCWTILLRRFSTTQTDAWWIFALNFT